MIPAEQVQNIEEATANIGTYLEQYGLRIIVSIVFFFIFVKLINYLIKTLDNLFTKNKVDSKMARPITRLIKYALYLILTLVIATFLGIETSSIIMILLIIAAFIAIAMQTTMANIGAGIMLLVIKPFKVGNYVEIRDHEGNIKEMNLYHTLITLGDNSVVFLPNSEVLNSDIINTDKKRKRRVDINIYVAYTSNFKKIGKIALETTKGDERILDDPKPSFIVRDVDLYGAKTRTRLWVKKADYWDVLYDYNEKILDAYKKAEVEFSNTDIALTPQSDSNS